MAPKWSTDYASYFWAGRMHFFEREFGCSLSLPLICPRTQWLSQWKSKLRTIWFFWGYTSLFSEKYLLSMCLKLVLTSPPWTFTVLCDNATVTSGTTEQCSSLSLHVRSPSFPVILSPVILSGCCMSTESMSSLLLSLKWPSFFILMTQSPDWSFCFHSRLPPTTNWRMKMHSCRNSAQIFEKLFLFLCMYV